MGESMTGVDSPVPLMHHDPDRSWITGMTVRWAFEQHSQPKRTFKKSNVWQVAVGGGGVGGGVGEVEFHNE